MPVPARASWSTQSVAGTQVEVYVPASTSKIGTGRGLVVVLHGCSQSVDSLRDFGNFETAAEDYGLVIAIPGVPNGGVFAGCWDYYGAEHTRSSRHNAAVISLAEAMTEDPTYDIDSSQVYVSGLSSGAGQAAVAGCLAPDIFAGVAIVAGPAVGTSATQIGTVASTGDQAAELCRQLAADSPGLDSQLAIAMTDTGDFIVAQGYAEVHAQMYGELFGGGLESMSSSSVDVATLPGSSPTGEGMIYSDAAGGRIMWLQTDGVGHAWPAGSGTTGGALSFVSGEGVNFSLVMAEFFTANNTRAGGDSDPSDSAGGGSTGGDAESSAGGGSSSGAAASSSDPTAGQGEGSASDTRDYIEPSGCQCETRGVGQNPTSWLVMLGLVAFLRSRKRRRLANVYW